MTTHQAQFDMNIYLYGLSEIELAGIVWFKSELCSSHELNRTELNYIHIYWLPWAAQQQRVAYLHKPLPPAMTKSAIHKNCVDRSWTYVTPLNAAGHIMMLLFSIFSCYRNRKSFNCLNAKMAVWYLVGSNCHTASRCVTSIYLHTNPKVVKLLDPILHLYGLTKHYKLKNNAFYWTSCIRLHTKFFKPPGEYNSYFFTTDSVNVIFDRIKSLICPLLHKNAFCSTNCRLNCILQTQTSLQTALVCRYRVVDFEK